MNQWKVLGSNGETTTVEADEFHMVSEGGCRIAYFQNVYVVPEVDRSRYLQEPFKSKMMVACVANFQSVIRVDVS